MKMEPIIQIGKSSLTPELTKAVEEALAARELIKISVLQNCMDDPRSLADMLAERKIIKACDVLALAKVLECTPNDLFAIVDG